MILKFEGHEIKPIKSLVGSEGFLVAITWIDIDLIITAFFFQDLEALCVIEYSAIRGIGYD